MKTITLPADTRHLYLDEVAHLIADYNEPEGPNDPDGVRYELVKIEAESELHQAATAGQLNVRHPGTYGPFPIELGLKRAVLLVPNVVAYLAVRGMAVVMEAPEQEAVTPATVAVGVLDEETVPAVANWKMQVQAEATAYYWRLRKSGANPTRHSIIDPMAKWCRDNNIKTDTKINPSANYLRTHVLGGKHWDVPN